MKLLCTADLHIGRRPSRLHESQDARRCSAANMWRRIVQLAVDEQVEAVLLAGDVVDRENRFFEAIGPLEEGLATLSEAGIPVFAVSGNHDFDVLPSLTQSVSGGLTLLGAGGDWHWAEVAGRDGTRLRLVGWSFAQQYMELDPLDMLQWESAADGAMTVGLLHCDLDVPGSRYAPVSRQRLHDVQANLWLLGHVHAPRFIERAGGSTLLYPGSPQAFDPGETGAHGPWLVELSPGQAPQLTQIPLSAVRYDTVEIDLTGADSRDAVRQRIVEGVRGFLHEVCQHLSRPEHVRLRVRLTGRTACQAELRQLVAPEHLTEFEFPQDGVVASVERFYLETRSAVDLPALAQSDSPPGRLARIILALERDEQTPELQHLLREASGQMAEVHRASNYSALVAEPLPSDVRRRLLEQSVALLDALVAQKEA